MKLLKTVIAFMLLLLSANTLYAYSNGSDISTKEEQVIELYIATFNRAPDKAGLDYWLNEMTNNNWTPEMVAQSMFMQPETENMYGDKDLKTFITSVYENVLNREPDSAGLDYWYKDLSSGNIPKEKFVIAIINGAKANGDDSDDAKVLKNKVEVGKYFTLEKGLNDVELARKVISEVSSDDTSVTKIKQEIEKDTSDNNFDDAILNATLQTQQVGEGVISVDKDNSSNYYISDDGDMVFTSNDDENLKRVELRVTQEWGLDDFDTVSIQGNVKLEVSKDTDEITYMQLHHKSNGAKPFVRLVYRKDKNNHPNSLWAVVRKNEDSSGDVSEWYFLGNYPQDEFISAKISVINGNKLDITVNNSNININIPQYWQNLDYDRQRFYFKAGLYFSGSNSYRQANVIYHSLHIKEI